MNGSTRLGSASPFLKTGVMFEDFHADGKTPLERDRLNKEEVKDGIYINSTFAVHHARNSIRAEGSF